MRQTGGSWTRRDGDDNRRLWRDVSTRDRCLREYVAKPNRRRRDRLCSTGEASTLEGRTCLGLGQPSRVGNRNPTGLRHGGWRSGNPVRSRSQRAHDSQHRSCRDFGPWCGRHAYDMTFADRRRMHVADVRLEAVAAQLTHHRWQVCTDDVRDGLDRRRAGNSRSHCLAVGGSAGSLLRDAGF